MEQIQIAASISDLLRNAAERCPDSTALLGPHRNPMSYGRLWDHIQRVAGGLAACGIGRGDRVAVVLRDGPEKASCFLAISAAATCAPLNPNYRADEFEFYLSDLNPKALIVEAGANSPAAAFARTRGIRVIELMPDVDAEAGAFSFDRIPLTQRSLPISRHQDETSLLLHTSGTTSRAKMVPLTQGNLCSSARNIAASLSLRAEDRCLNVMPLFHIHGLVGALLSSIAAGSSVVCTPGFHALHFFEWFEEFQPTWYTAVPTMHQAILDRAVQKSAIRSPSRLRFIRSCSSTLPTRLMAELEDEFQVPVVEAYGMTEASHQVSTNPLPPGIRKPGSVGLPTGCEITVLDEAGAPLPAGEAGAVFIRGPNVTHGYANNLEATSYFSGGWFCTGDQGRLDSAGYLFLTGRTKEIINRGGEKISPREVEDVLLGHPAVAQAVAFAIPDRRLGEDIAAAVVLREPMPLSGGRQLETALREFTAARLAHFKVPCKIVVVQEIPKGPTGKPQRVGMAAKLGLTLSSQPTDQPFRPLTPPRTQTEIRLVGIWQQVLGAETIGIYDNFFTAGGDSITALLLCSRVGAAFGAEVSFLRLFENPTVEGLANWLDSGSDEHARPQPPQIQPTKRSGPIPLSYSQQQFWFLDRFKDGYASSIRSEAFRLCGPLDVDVLRHSLNQIVARHEILRTNYWDLDGLPVQGVRETSDLALTVTDLSSIPEPERLLKVHEFAREEAWRPFDLSNDLMMRACLIRLTPVEHIFILTTHHIASDGWSSRLILRELSELYGAQCEGRAPVLPELPIQYADFALFQRQCHDGGSFDEQIEYWKKRLAGAPERLHLPTDRPRPVRQTYLGGVESMVLPKELLAALKGVGLQQRATLYMILLAAFQVLLYRYTTQEDIVIGSPIAGRRNAQTEPLVGLFMNVLALRADLRGGPSFREFLTRTRESTLEAHSNQDVPVERLIEHLHLNRDTHHPATQYQVLFQLRNLGMESASLGPVKVEPFDFDTGSSQFDLSLDIRQRPEGLYCALNYNSDLYDRETARRILRHYQNILTAVTTNIDERISTLNILSEEERRQILSDWNETVAEYPRESSMHELIEARARSMPEAIAVVCRDETITYGELNRRANDWAQRLRDRGVSRGVLVGILLPRSASFAVAVLSVLKSGGTYVPLDPKYPKQRLVEMLEASRCSLLITGSKERQSLPQTTADVLCVDQDDRHGIVAGDDPPVNEVRPDDCSCVIFTSGSTGSPNGVSIEHRSLVNYSCFFRNYADIGIADRVLQFNSPSFDMASHEIFPCWLAGATLVVWPESYAPAVPEFLEFLEREQITLIALPTAYWHEWVSQMTSGDLPFPSRLRAVMIGGEKALTSKLTVWRNVIGGRVRLYNAYGPTETTVVSTFYDTDGGGGVADSVPIGRPIANVTHYILDRNLQPLPIGIPGELYIGGAGVARGYLNRPELTAEKFIGNPFRDLPDPRLYKTGDRVRYLADGTIEFLGRLDDQVKLRGFRIELSELECVLASHPDVRAAAASLRQESADQIGLVAYVVPDSSTPLDADILRSFLKERLPDYMLPSHYVFLEELPLTPNGKIDRNALPAPGQTAMARAGFEEPQGSTEEGLVRIWSQILSAGRIGIRDNFFELGGNSLKAVQMCSKVRNHFGVELPLSFFYQNPTIQGIESFMAGAPCGAEAPWGVWEHYRNHGSQPPLIGFAQIGAIAKHLASEFPFHVLNHRVDFSARVPPFYPSQTVEEVAQQHLKYLRALRPKGPYLLLGYCFGGLIAYEVARRLTEEGEDVPFLGLIESRPPAHIPSMATVARAEVEPVHGSSDGSPPEVIFEQQMLQVIREMLLKYEPLPYGGKVWLFHGSDWVGADGWVRLARGGVTACVVPGTHDSIIKEPCVLEFADKLNAGLREAIRNAKP